MRRGVTELDVRRPALALGLVAAFALAAAAPGPAAPRPNIVVVLTDDQRADTLWAMPEVQKHLVGRGVTFENAFVSNSICCPARATFLTGNYAHTTGVYSNRRPFGAAWAFARGGADRSTIATWLRRSGYRTAFLGKYFNGYWAGRPPGWDEWRALLGGSFTSYAVNVNGKTRRFTRPHVSTYLGDRATGFIRRAKGKRPFFLYVATPVPHHPATPLPKHKDAFSDLPPYDSPAYLAPDVDGKPAYVRARAAPDPDAIERWRRKQLRSLLAADAMVGRIVETLRETGRLANTIIVYASDNGMAWGDHRLGAAFKSVPYESSIRVPFVVRYDRRVKAPRAEQRLVTNADLAPTLARLAGVRPPAVEGRSLVPLLEERTTTWRNAVLLENQGGHGSHDPMPAYCGVRTATAKYVLYATDEEELYDLAADPFELVNRAGDPAYEAERLAGLAALRRLCFPTPPGYRPSTLATIRGTRGAERLVGGRGNDYIQSWSVRGTIRAGRGNDTIYAEAPTVEGLARATFQLRRSLGPGRVVLAGPGNDRVYARNGRRDVVDCGPGRDLAVVDRFDVVRGCESVRRTWRR